MQHRIKLLHGRYSIVMLEKVKKTSFTANSSNYIRDEQ
jgi:hypothetical protein